MLRKTTWENLPSAILRYTFFGYANPQDEKNLSEVSDHFKKSCAKELKTATFLQHVAYGEQEQAEEMLKQDPDLLLQKGNVTDLSGRTFSKITALQYALWALDSHMWKMLYKYFGDRNNAYEQQQELESSGIEYCITTSIQPIREKHFEFIPIEVTLYDYATHCEGWIYGKCIDYWCKWIGGLQRQFPVHVVNEYCHPSRSFDPYINFNEKLLPRQCNFYDSKNRCKASWFEAKGLGIDFAIAGDGQAASAGYLGGVAVTKRRAESDLATLKSLHQVRMNELEAFYKELNNLKPVICLKN